MGNGPIGLDGVSRIFEGWPEKTNRKVIAVVLVALLLGVPIISMTALSVEFDRQVVTIEPRSHRAFHFGFYGFGTIEYRDSTSSGSDLYMVSVDRTNYYRLVAGKPYEYSMYARTGPGGGGSSFEAGLIWNKYLVLVNDGYDVATVTLEIHATAYLSALPAVAILVVASALAYYVGRRVERAAELDPTDPLVTARRRMRRRVLRVISVLSLVPLGTMLAFPFLVPARFSTVGELYGFFAGVLLVGIIAFQLKFSITRRPVVSSHSLTDLAYRLRISGYRVTEGKNRMVVQISSTSTVQITTKKKPDGMRVLYKAGATPLALSILIILFLTVLGSPMALALCLFMFYRTSSFAGTRLLPRMTSLPPGQQAGPEKTTRMMLVESLSEGRRLSAEAFESARSNYHDYVIIMAVVGVIVGAALAVFTYSQIDSDSKGRIALAIGVLSAVVFSAVTWLLLSRRFKERLAELKRWTTILEAALAREVAGQAPSGSDPSSFELIANSVEEMPKWLKERRRAGGYRRPLFWLLLFFMSYGAFESGLTAMFLIADHRSEGFIALAVCITLVVLTIVFNRIWKRQLDRELKDTLAESNRRYDALRTEMEKLLIGG